MAGIVEIAQGIKASCPHCHRSLECCEIATELFKRILTVLESGERVQISDFGVFSTKPTKERVQTGFGGTPVVVPARQVIRFKAATKAKMDVNPGLDLLPPSRIRRDEKRRAASKKGKGR